MPEPRPAGTSIIVRLSDDGADAQQLEELTLRLRDELLQLHVPVEVAGGGDAPPGARAAELIALGTLLLTVAQSPVLAAVIDAVSRWLGDRRNRTVKLDIGGDTLEISGIGGAERQRLVDAWLNRHRGTRHPSLDGGRHALIVANHDYRDEGLRRLRAPAHDAAQLAAVLRDPAIGGFDVTTVLNESAPVITEAVEEFFADRDPDDLLLLYFSGHGVKDEDGELYFAAAPTKLNRLAATGVAADFVNRRMNRSRSRRIVLLLDCCYAGAFSRGMVPRGGSGVGLEQQFGGRGRAVITASSAVEYAFEGQELTSGGGQAPSVFTGALVDGLRTGEADRDQDGFIGLDELYDFIHDRVTSVTPNQTPGKWTFDLQGDLHIARRGTPITAPMQLPHGLQEAVEHPLPGIRAGAVTELERLLRGGHAGLALSARLTLERLAEDDSRSVSAAAATALATVSPPPSPPPTPTPSPPIPIPRPQPVQPVRPAEAPAKPFSKLAIAAFVTGLVGLPFYFAFIGIAVLILGQKARRQIRQTGLRGDKLALIAMFLGALETVGALVLYLGLIANI
ncbi:MAG TPA: caspase family protein [Candidatus Limnocylindrales bacterium]